MRTFEAEDFIKATRESFLNSLRKGSLILDPSDHLFVGVYDIIDGKVVLKRWETGETYIKPINEVSWLLITESLLEDLGFTRQAKYIYHKDGLKLSMVKEDAIVELQIDGRHKEVEVFSFHLVQNFYKDVTGEELIKHEIYTDKIRYKPYGL